MYVLIVPLHFQTFFTLLTHLYIFIVTFLPLTWKWLRFGQNIKILPLIWIIHVQNQIMVFSHIGSCFEQPSYLLWHPIWIMPNFDFSIWRCWQKVIFCRVIRQRVNDRFMSFIQGVYYLGFNQIPKTNPAILWATNNLCITATQAAVHFIVFVYMTCKPEYNNDPLVL